MKTGAFLSTGFFTMILAIDMCDSIHVYGMVDDGYCGWEAVLSLKPNREGVFLNFLLKGKVFDMRRFTSPPQPNQLQCCPLPLLREEPNQWVQDVQGPRAHATRRPPLHHREGHLCQMGDAAQDRVQTPCLEPLNVETSTCWEADESIHPHLLCPCLCLRHRCLKLCLSLCVTFLFLYLQMYRLRSHLLAFLSQKVSDSLLPRSANLMEVSWSSFIETARNVLWYKKYCVSGFGKTRSDVNFCSTFLVNKRV